MPEELSGQIAHITFFNEETGFTIAQVKVTGRREAVTAVGTFLSPAPGETIRMKGEWHRHARYGEQFKVQEYTLVVPATVDGIRRYLGSGRVQGIGPVMAARIVDRFGKTTLDIIGKDIARLAEVEGIGPKRIEKIARAWQDQQEIREVMLFLQSHGVGTGFGAKIFKAYGDRSIAVVRQNPYRLAAEIHGIGFLTADRIARQLGIPRDAALRVESGIHYLLTQVSEDGHVYSPYRDLLQTGAEMLGVDRQVVADAIHTLAADHRIVIEDLDAQAAAEPDRAQAVFLAAYHRSETDTARRLGRLLREPPSFQKVNPERAIQWAQKRLVFTLADKQTAAIRACLQHKVVVITGGPGTGKTTIIRGVLEIFTRLAQRVLLAAPTGRAAKRMGEAAGKSARTIHRLLEFSFTEGGFQRNAQRPLACDVLIVDEASMIDILLMHQMLQAVPDQATLVLVGDVNQLPSVGAGNVLKDIIASGVVTVVELSEIFRQAQQSRIVVNAHAVNSGNLSFLGAAQPIGKETDFYFIENENPERVRDIIVKMTTERIPRRFGLDPVDDIQVLSPMHKGLVGTVGLNSALQQALNPGEGGIMRSDRCYRVGDKVMQIRNNYDKEVFNGDIGRISRVDSAGRTLAVTFDGREIDYDSGDLDELALAYAVSVHKSQGSEYPAVIFPILTQHYVMLQRNLIYTAITRGRELVVLIGSRKALAIGVRNDKPRLRFTRLADRLAAAAGPGIMGVSVI